LAKTERYQHIRSMLGARRSVSLQELLANIDASGILRQRGIGLLEEMLGNIGEWQMVRQDE
jgi:hypothetical protein